MKLDAGVEVINYPQHMDMYNQFLKPLSDYEKEPGLIESAKAIIPEMSILDKFGKEYYEKSGRQLDIKICVTGPIELYIKQQSFTIYPDMVYNYSKSVNDFIKNSLIDTKYVKTSIVSIDEPSFGYVEMFNVEDNDLIKIFDKSLEGIRTSNQIHLHTLSKASVAMQTDNINVLTCEYASNNSNVIPKRELDSYDKFIRVGITRTNVDSIIAAALDKGSSWNEIKTLKGTLNLIDSKERIKRNLLDALELYGDRLKYVGPDCGLSGWHPPLVAYELLRRTYEVIEEVKKGL